MKHKLLIVDDQPGIRMLLSDILQSEGYEVEEAQTGKEAIDKANQTTYDLIILDYKLPVVDGAQFIEYLTKNHINSPIILMSGLVENISKEIKEKDIVKEIIAKPFDVNDFCSIVQRILLVKQ